jgi:hypothetical protein
MKVWKNYKEVDNTIKQLLYWHKSGKEVPSLIIQAVKSILKKATKGQVLHFYNELLRKCPDLLNYFQDIEFH